MVYACDLCHFLFSRDRNRSSVLIVENTLSGLPYKKRNLSLNRGNKNRKYDGRRDMMVPPPFFRNLASVHFYAFLALPLLLWNLLR